MIREIQLKDKDQWKKLYRGYADFYKAEINDKILQTVWGWLNDNKHELQGIVYEVDNKIVALKPRTMIHKNFVILAHIHPSLFFLISYHIKIWLLNYHHV